jgi:hypothetical protein
VAGLSRALSVRSGRFNPVKNVVERSGVAHAKVDLLACLFGFAAGSIDHLRR